MTNFIEISGLHEISADEWDALNPTSYPFARHAFLNALETTRCVDSEHLKITNTGWQPNHLVKRNAQNELVAAIPAYIKRHSYGEYVFDWQWAEAYAQYGMNYYPKLLCAIPFTPATGPRLLGKEHHFENIGNQLSQLCSEQGLSGWHLNFPMKQESDTLLTAASVEVQPRLGCQFHWHNNNFTSFDHYLASFVSRKRKSVVKERRKVSEQGIRLERKTGEEITPEDIQFFYQCYLDTYQKRRSSPYLSEAFFLKLIVSMAEQMMLVLASHNNEPCAAALYFFDDNTLYGRYWGCLQDFDSLHFEACYYQGIEFCIEKKLQRFDPGTQGEHKISRGFRPVLTHSLHCLQHPGFNEAVGRFLEEETEHILAYQRDAETLLPFHRDDGSAIKPAQHENNE